MKQSVAGSCIFHVPDNRWIGDLGDNLLQLSTSTDILQFGWLEVGQDFGGRPVHEGGGEALDEK